MTHDGHKHAAKYACVYIVMTPCKVKVHRMDVCCLVTLTHIVLGISLDHVTGLDTIQK